MILILNNLHTSMYVLFANGFKVVLLKITNSIPCVSRNLDEKRSFHNVSFKSHAFPALFL